MLPCSAAGLAKVLVLFSWMGKGQWRGFQSLWIVEEHWEASLHGRAIEYPEEDSMVSL